MSVQKQVWTQTTHWETSFEHGDEIGVMFLKAVSIKDRQQTTRNSESA